VHHGWLVCVTGQIKPAFPLNALYRPVNHHIQEEGEGDGDAEEEMNVTEDEA
jgi:hypothetical protein